MYKLLFLAKGLNRNSLQKGNFRAQRMKVEIPGLRVALEGSCNGSFAIELLSGGVLIDFHKKMNL